MPLPDPAPLLPYESPRPKIFSRPWWVYAVAVVYLLGLTAVLMLPAFAAMNEGQVNDGFVWFVTIYAVVLTLCGLSLIILPVRAARNRPIKRSSIWPPVIASGLLAGGLFLGAALALWELFKGEKEADISIALLFVSLAIWCAWSILFAVIAFRWGPERIGGKLHRYLIAGSVLELLIAVPSHIIVRRRNECCAGFETGAGICLGVSIMLISFGPSVLLLYHRRRKQITPPPPVPFDPK